MEWIDRTAPRVRARVAGVVYLLYFLTAIVGELFVQQAGVSGLQTNPTFDGTTASAVFDHQGVFLTGFVIGLISIALYVALMAFFYELFKPVSRTITLIAVFSTLVGQAVAAAGSVLQLGPIVMLGGARYLSVFDHRQLAALGAVFLNLGAQAGPVTLVFAGVFQIAIGYVMYRSTFLPRILGILIALAGVGWFIFVAPPITNAIGSYAEILGFVAEAALMLWLIVKGVNDERWYARATAAGLVVSKPGA